MNSRENILLSNIFKFGRLERLYELIKSLILFLSIFIVLWISVTFADILFYFSEITRWGLWFLNGFFLCYLIYKFVIKPWINIQFLRTQSDLSSICQKINSYYPEIKNTLSTAYNLITKTQKDQISGDLRVAAIGKYLEQFENYNFSDRLKISDYIPSLKFILPVFLGAIFLLSFKSSEIFHSTLRLINPSNAYTVLPDYLFDVQPGDTKIIKGGSIEFKVNYSGPVLKECNLMITQQSEDKSQKIQLKPENGSYYTQLKDINQSFMYQIYGLPSRENSLENKILSRVFNVKVLIPPIVSNLDIVVTPPAYSGQETQYLPRNIGDVNGLTGSRISFRASVNKALETAALEFSDGRQVNCTIQGLRVSTGFTIRNNETYKIQLQDTAGLSNQNPIDYAINVMPDNPPFVEIVQPGKDIEIQLDAKLAVQAEILDDYGISRASLFFKYLHSSKSSSDTIWHKMNLPLPSVQKRQTVTSFWDFNNLPVAFDDGIEYYVQATDNNNINGPGIGKSKIYYIHFPSLEDIFDSFTENENKQIDKMEDVSKQSEDLKKKLEKINRELKRADEIEWDQKQQIENTLEQQKKLQDKIQDIRKDLEDIINNMEANELISPELLEKYTQLQELFQEIATPELIEAMKNLQQTLDKADPKQVQQALQNFALNQEEFQKKIERTMELLKQVQLEQKMDQLVQKASKLSEQQNKISQQLQSKEVKNKQTTEQLINQQKQQENLLENIQQDLSNLLKEPQMSKFQKTRDLLKTAGDKASEMQQQKKMQNIKKQVEQQELNSAADISQNLQDQMTQMQASIEQAQSEMLNQNKNDIQEKMLSAMQKLLQLSYDQEEILDNTQNTSPLNNDFADISVKQGRMQQNFQKLISDLVQLSKQTFFIQPGLSKTLGKSQISMAKSIDELSERNQFQAMQQQSKSLEGLNESIMQMQKSMSQMAQSQSATGFDQFMEQLKQMAGSQGQVNEQTLDLFQQQGNEGSLSMQQQGQMQRLAGEQAALQKALEKMSDEMGSRQDVMGRLGELSGKMDEVVQDLVKQNVNRETINRQREILSRMLDAQKSVREREYSKKRKAEIAKNYKVIDPGELKNLSDAQQKKLRDALKKSLNEGYQTDYQNLIELYFKQLIQQQSENN